MLASSTGGRTFKPDISRQTRYQPSHRRHHYHFSGTNEMLTMVQPHVFVRASTVLRDAARVLPLPLCSRSYPYSGFHLVLMYGQRRSGVLSSVGDRIKAANRSHMTRFLKPDCTAVNVKSGTPPGAACPPMFSCAVFFLNLGPQMRYAKMPLCVEFLTSNIMNYSVFTECPLSYRLKQTASPYRKTICAVFHF